MQDKVRTVQETLPTGEVIRPDREVQKGLSSVAPGPLSWSSSGSQPRQYPRARPFIKRILVPTDFSASSARAVRLAIALARQSDAALTILHVIDINAQSVAGESLPAADLMKRLWETGRWRMTQLAFSLGEQVDAHTSVEEGLPWQKIVEKSHEADILVLANGAHKPRWSFFRKHTTEAVLEKAACPVMVVSE